MRSLPPRRTALAWDCASAALLLNRTGAACGLPTTLRAAHDFVSHYLPTARHATLSRLEIALTLVTTLTATTRPFECIRRSMRTIEILRRCPFGSAHSSGSKPDYGW